MDIEVTINPQALGMLDQLNGLVYNAIVESCMPAMAKPIIVKATAIAPSSRKGTTINGKSGPTRAKWGKNATRNPKTGKVNFDPVVWAKDDSGQHVTYRVRKYSSPILIVGTKYPQGNKQQFLVPKSGSKIHYYWGKKPRTQILPVNRRFMFRAYDETVPQQHVEFKKTFEKRMKQPLRWRAT